MTRGKLPIRPWSTSECRATEREGGARCVVAKLSDRHHVEVVQRRGEKGVYDCSQGPPRIRRPEPNRPGDSARPLDFEGPVCAGVERDLFPSTTVYIVATFVEPNAKHYDPRQKAYVNGPITSKVYYQFAGVRDLPAAMAARCCTLWK